MRKPEPVRVWDSMGLGRVPRGGVFGEGEMEAEDSPAGFAPSSANVGSSNWERPLQGLGECQLILEVDDVRLSVLDDADLLS